MEEFKNKAFVCYGSFYGAIKDLPDDVELQCYRALMEYGLNGTYQSDNTIVNSLMSAFIPNIDAAQDRYDKAVESGKRGGRPSSINKDEVQELKAEGKTQKQIAEMLGISERTVQRHWNTTGHDKTTRQDTTTTRQEHDTRQNTTKLNDTNNIINIEEKITRQNLNNNINNNINNNNNNNVVSCGDCESVANSTTKKIEYYHELGYKPDEITQILHVDISLVNQTLSIITKPKSTPSDYIEEIEYSADNDIECDDLPF